MAQTVYYPADGIYNGFLQQINIVECDNNNTERVGGSISMFGGDGSELVNQGFALEPFGSVHIILNDLVNIVDSYGTFSISLDGDSSLGDRVSCRTVFYKTTPAGSEKDYDFSYVIPVGNPDQGVLSGIFNSINPGAERIPVQNWLSILNSSDDSFSAVVEIYGQGGELINEVNVSNLGPRGRTDIPLGHIEGETTGVYKVRPANPGQQYQALLIRYGPHFFDGRFSFAFPLQAVAGTCQGSPLFASSMGSIFTQNWLEMANTNEFDVSINVRVKDRFGALLRDQAVLIPSLRQHHIYLNEIIDPDGTGNVGTVEVSCEDPSNQILAQSAYYGSHNSMNTAWAYAVQSKTGQTAREGSQLSFPMNTFLGMGNWIKIAEEDGLATGLNFSLFDSQGSLRSSNLESISASGTLDFDVHSKVAPDIVGSTIVSSEAGSGISGHVLRTLPERSGAIGSIVYIPASIQPFSDIPSVEGFTGNPQSLAPYRDFLTDQEITHFFTKASFGAHPSERTQLRDLGLSYQLNLMLNAPPNASVNTYIENPEEINWNETKVAWMKLMIDGANPLQERMALIFHDLFATNCRAADNESCRDHVELLRNNALGNFRDLAQEITIDRLMLHWLNGNQNEVEAPDENYSREFWELFTLGEASLHQGQWRLYDSQDIIESSRSFTGWRTYSPDGERVVFNEYFHDFGEKTIWAGTPYEATGAFNQSDIVNLTLDTRPESARWIAQRLFSALVHDHPEPSVVNQLADQLVATNWEIKPVVETILRSEAFFSAESRNNRVKDAITFYVGFLRTTRMPYNDSRFSWRFTHQYLGFEPTRPPSVNGWPINKHEGALQSAYFLSWLTGYANMMNLTLGDIRGEEYTFDVLSLIPASRFNPSPAGVVDELTTLMGVELNGEERQVLIEYVSTDRRYDGEDRVADFTDNPGALSTKVRGVIWMLSQHRNYLTF